MKRYYLDANFLTSFLFAEHENRSKALYILQQLLQDAESIFLISTLTFDETWMSLHRCSNESEIKSFSEFCDQVEVMFKTIMQDPKFQIIETVNPSKLIEYAFIGARKYNLRPRDSFHYAYVKLWGATILTFDTDFINTDLDLYGR